MVNELISIFKNSANHFDGQEPNEKVLLLLRRHPFTILLRIIFLGLASLIPVVIGAAFMALLESNGWLTLFLLISSLWYLALWISAFYALMMYTLNTVIITDKRIIDSDQHGFFHREISELHSSRIQDVSIKTSGVLETFFKFGDVTVQTAASEKKFVFHEMPEPENVKDTIMKLAHTQRSETTIPETGGVI